MSEDFRVELAFLGAETSPSFVRESGGDGVAECIVRTLEESVLWVRHFAAVAELVEALRQSRRQYDEHWLLERHGYRTPAQARAAWSAAVGALDRAPPGRMVG